MEPPINHHHHLLSPPFSIPPAPVEARDPEATQPEVGVAPVKEEEGNEWLDYKEEQERDYSGLRLRQLEEALPQPEEEPQDNQADDQTPVEPAWKAVEGQPQPAPASVAAVQKDETNKSVYISPALRNAALLAPMKMGRATKAAPDLASDAYFPALGTEPQKPVVLGKLNPAPRLGPQRSAWGAPAGGGQSGVSLGNRYNTLDTDDS